MHGHTATRRSEELSSNRTAIAPITPASSAAQNGCRKRFVLTAPRARRRKAPAAALTNISIAADRCSTPKITASATAPAAAASANNHVGCRRRLRDRCDRLHCVVRRKSSGPDIVDCPHGGGHAIHVHTGGFGCYDGDQSRIGILNPKLQFSPARHDRGAQTEAAPRRSARSHHLVGGLAIDVKNPDEGENEIGAAPAESYCPRRAATRQDRLPSRNCRRSLPSVKRRSPHMAAPFFWDRRRDRIRPR